jgi:hypothetical protein
MGFLTFSRSKLLTSFTFAAIVSICSFGLPAKAFDLADREFSVGGVRVGVDAYGSFGGGIGGEGTADALLNLLVADNTLFGIRTTTASGVAIGATTDAGGNVVLIPSREFLSTGLGSGLPPQTVLTLPPAGAESSFTLIGASPFNRPLDFQVTQVLTPYQGGIDFPYLSTAGSEEGSVLTQTYRITNPSNSPISFDLVRYLDAVFVGDVEGPFQFFEGETIGGRLLDGTNEVLFERFGDVFVGITATVENGASSVSNRYEIGSPSFSLQEKIVDGAALDNVVFGDGADLDQISDVRADIALALRDLIILGPNETATYTTTTIFATRNTTFNPPGFSQNNPILPQIIGPGGGFGFNDVPNGRWYDPPITFGYEYSMVSDSLFTEILGFPTGFNAPFSVSVGGVDLGQFSPGATVDFVSLLGQGVPTFSVTGLSPLVDPTDPLGFPLQLAFSTQTASFRMTPLAIPEPTSMLGVAAATLIGGVLRVRTKRK